MKNFMLLLVAAFLFQASSAQTKITTVFIIRHAERLSGDDLSTAGLTRARELKRILMAAKIDSIFSTNTVRTRKTVSVLADSTHLPVTTYADPASIAARIDNYKESKRILIVGHSNTVASLIRACGCTPPPAIDPNLPETQFDNLFQLIISKTASNAGIIKRCELIELKYGGVTF